MTEITFRQALQRGLREALDADPDVFLMGEDIGKYDGAYAVTPVTYTHLTLPTILRV